MTTPKLGYSYQKSTMNSSQRQKHGLPTVCITVLNIPFIFYLVQIVGLNICWTLWSVSEDRAWLCRDMHAYQFCNETVNQPLPQQSAASSLLHFCPALDIAPFVCTIISSLWYQRRGVLIQLMSPQRLHDCRMNNWLPANWKFDVSGRIVNFNIRLQMNNQKYLLVTLQCWNSILLTLQRLRASPFIRPWARYVRRRILGARLTWMCSITRWSQSKPYTCQPDKTRLF